MRTADEYLAAAPVAPDTTITYGPDPAQRVDLYRPPGGDGAGPHPLVLLLHGGCWQASSDRTPLGGLAAAVRDQGYGVANAEYRRLGEGGGWPATFDDVVAALTAARAEMPRADPDRVVAVGHSAGGHLALWLATQPERPLRGVVALAPVADLEVAAARSICGSAAVDLLGGADDFASRLADASPAHRLPIGVPHRHLGGATDPLVPADTLETFTAAARAAGDRTHLTLLPDAGHFDVVAPAAHDLIAAEIAAVLS